MAAVMSADQETPCDSIHPSFATAAMKSSYLVAVSVAVTATLSLPGEFSKEAVAKRDTSVK